MLAYTPYINWSIEFCVSTKIYRLYSKIVPALNFIFLMYLIDHQKTYFSV